MTYKELAQQMAQWYRERPDGWCQRVYHNNGAMCIRGLATKLSEDDAAAFLYLRFPDGMPALWNDKPGRTREEVIAKLEEIANEP